MSTFRDDDNWDSCDDDGDDDGGDDDDDGDDDDRDSCDDDREDFDLGASDLIKLSCLLCHSWGRKSISYHFDKKKHFKCNHRFTKLHSPNLQPIRY